MPDRSFLPADPYVVEAVQRFSDAARYVIGGATSLAEPIIANLDAARLHAHWDAVMAKPGSLRLPVPAKTDRTTPGPSPKTARERVRRPSGPGVELERQVYAEDRWTCRWCGTPVIARHAFLRMHLIFPVSFPRDSTNDGRHGLILAASASVDHVVPLARGGTNDRENLVTACWPCQFSRANWTHQEVGLEDPRRYAAPSDDWDGVAWFKV